MGCAYGECHKIFVFVQSKLIKLIRIFVAILKDSQRYLQRILPKCFTQMTLLPRSTLFFPHLIPHKFLLYYRTNFFYTSRCSTLVSSIRIYPMKITPRIALVLTLVGTFFWGSNFQATKIALTTVSPWTASFERFLIAVIAIFLIMIFKEGLRWHVLSQNFISYIFLGIIGVAGFNGALFVGLQTSNPITASLIMATTPISANIIEAIMNKSFPTCERVIGMLISMFGVYLVITNGRFLSNHVSFAKGDIMILLGSIGWAFYTVGTRSFVKNATPLETTSWTMLSGTVALGVLTFLFESPLQETMSMSGASLFALLWMGVAGSVLAYLFWNIGIAIRGPGKTAIFFNFVPISALLVQILFGFIPQIMQIIGVFITIFGVLIGQGYIFSLLGSRKAVPNAHKE